MNVAGGRARAKLAKRRPPLHARGAESAPQDEPAPEREALLNEAVRLFGRGYGRAVSREEARQMLERLTTFFDLLAEWEQRAQGGSVEGGIAA